MLGKLAPHHREKLASLIAGTPEFSPTTQKLRSSWWMQPSGTPIRTNTDSSSSRKRIACSVLPASGRPRWPRVASIFTGWSSPKRRDDAESERDPRRGRARASRQGARLIRLETAGIDSYRAARAFYERTGYAEAGRIRDFYWPGNDLYIYVKYLAR